MKKINLDNFFRKDLNLKSRWWHRFLSVSFVFLFIILTIYNIAFYSTSDLFEGGVGIQKWKKIATLAERITPEIKPIAALIGVGEKIGENDRVYVLNDEPDEYYKIVLNDVYCSTNLIDNYEKIKTTRIVDGLYIGGSFNRSKVSPETFVNYIKQNNIRCLIVDAYTTYGPDGQTSGKLSFLEPDKSYQENWSVFEKSTPKTVLYFLEMIPVILISSFLFFVICLIVYYKIFIYIIFGSKLN